jgi:hypothetical protein
MTIVDEDDVDDVDNIIADDGMVVALASAVLLANCD